MSKIYAVIGSALLAAYLTIEVRGIVFSSATDTKGSIGRSSRGGRSSGGGGVFFWGSGYRGGK